MTIQTVTQISAAARGKWPVILQMLRIDVPENGRHGPCPKCGGKDRFRLDDLDGRGTWICSQCGNGDGLDLVKLVTGYSVRKAAQEVAQVLNVPDVQELPVKPARQKAPKRDMGLTVAALMKESHTGESAYLTGKGFAGFTSCRMRSAVKVQRVSFSRPLPCRGVISACRAQQRNGGSMYPATVPATPAWHLLSAWPLLHHCYGWLVWTAAATT